MISRWIENDVLDALKYRRGIHLTGARQVGKTTLTKLLNLEYAERITLDDEGIRTSAMRDPISIVERKSNHTLIIDEVQKVPQLLDAIKIQLDQNTEKGQYLLTGSANLRFVKRMHDSLAGRLETIRLRTLTLAELNGSHPNFLEHAFNGIFEQMTSPLSKRDIIHYAFAGGYPEPMELPERRRKRWYQEYLSDLLMHDIQDITEIKKVDVLNTIAEWLLAHSAQFFAIDELSTKVSTAKQTVETYLSAIRALFLIDEVPAWSKSDYARIGKRSKWIAADTGLITNILNWKEDEVANDDLRNGKLVESWVYHELVTQADMTDCHIYQYRDKDKREIDFIIENDVGNLLGIEVKAGATISDSDFKHLRWFGKTIAKTPFHGIVFYSGKELLSFGSNLWAVPLSMLA